MSDLPALLKAYRARHGWTARQAAEATGVAYQTWIGWEGGKRAGQHAWMERLLREALA